ncbi:MAG: carboxymuconolactone decarboxylase family protein [Moraxella sp.]|nr:carboxymuconolactone decarboxylase family protein [Moraxella sp.]
MKKLILITSLVGCALFHQAHARTSQVQTNQAPTPASVFNTAPNRLASQAPTQVTIGQERLGAFAPQFADINDNLVYGQIWSRQQELPLRERSMITISAMMAHGDFEQLKFQMERAKEYGVTKQEMSELITHLAFYVGGPRAWSAFQRAMEVYD